MEQTECPRCGHPLDLSSPLPLDSRCPSCSLALTQSILSRVGARQAAYLKGLCVVAAVAAILLLLLGVIAFFVSLGMWFEFSNGFLPPGSI